MSRNKKYPLTQVAEKNAEYLARNLKQVDRQHKLIVQDAKYLTEKRRGDAILYDQYHSGTTVWVHQGVRFEIYH